MVQQYLTHNRFNRSLWTTVSGPMGAIDTVRPRGTGRGAERSPSRRAPPQVVIYAGLSVSGSPGPPPASGIEHGININRCVNTKTKLD